MAAGQFAALLKSARERKGLTQAVVAERCRLTGSYISLLESGKKPAPSDGVVRRLASALEMDLEEALQVAHLDRAPEDLRKSVDRLRSQAAREKELRERTAETLFPFSIWSLVPMGLPARMRRAVGPTVDAEVLRAIDHLADVARTAMDLATFHRETRRVLRELPDEKRKRFLDAAPALLQDATAPRFVPAPEPGLPPDIRPGDTLVVDPVVSPAEGDPVLLEEAGRPSVRRFEAGMTGVQGVVVEVRRRLK